jgi:hypothetical protein
MLDFKQYLAESVEVMGDSLEYITTLLEEKSILSRLVRFERDSIGDLTSIAFDVNDLSPKKRENIIASLQKHGFKTASIEFHDWNKLWIVSIERIRIQRKSSANALVSSIYYGIVEQPKKQEKVEGVQDGKKSMLERIIGKTFHKGDKDNNGNK